MNRYNESKLIDIKAIKNDFFYNTVLTKAKKYFSDTKKIQKKGEEVFFQKNLENTFQTKKKVFY